VYGNGKNEEKFPHDAFASAVLDRVGLQLLSSGCKALEKRG
jgi:hypothetical protein